MTFEQSVAVGWAVFVVGFVALGVYAAWSAHRFRLLLLAEQVRGRFAEARHRLVSKVLRGELDPNSATFRTLYFVQTSMMRRDDQYDAMWGTLVAALKNVEEEHGNDRLAAERAGWDADMREIAGLTGQAIIVMLVEYSMVLRMIAALHRWFRWPGADVQPPIEDRVERIETRHRPDRATVRAFLPVLGVSGYGAAA